MELNHLTVGFFEKCCQTWFFTCFIVDNHWMGAWFLNMRNLTSNIIHEDFVVFAKQMKLKDQMILRNYVMKTAMPAQLTGLALQLGTVFSGTIITEIVFNYPGLGTLAFTAIMQSDYNLVMGITLCSIMSVALATLFVDLLLPFIDPRIQYTVVLLKSIVPL